MHYLDNAATTLVPEEVLQAMADALRAVALPAVEVHITDPEQREPFRRVSYTGMACCKTIKGQGIDGYRQAILYLKEQLKK